MIPIYHYVRSHHESATDVKEPEAMRSEEQQKKKGKAKDQQGKKRGTRIWFKGRSEKAASSGTTAEQRLHHFYVHCRLSAAPKKSVALSQPPTLNIKCTQISQGHENLEEQKVMAS